MNKPPYERIGVESFPALFLDPDVKIKIVMGGRATCLQDQWKVAPRIIDDHLLYLPESGRFHAEVGAVKTTIGPGDFFGAQPAVE